MQPSIFVGIVLRSTPNSGHWPTGKSILGSQYENMGIIQWAIMGDGIFAHLILDEINSN